MMIYLFEVAPFHKTIILYSVGMCTMYIVPGYILPGLY